MPTHTVVTDFQTIGTASDDAVCDAIAHAATVNLGDGLSGHLMYGASGRPVEDEDDAVIIVDVERGP